LPRVLDKGKTLAALGSLWKYNFTTDVGPYVKSHIGGRPYAVSGEGGMVMNTNPHNENNPYGENESWQLGYFHECMSGFEHQVAAHMMAEGMIEQSLTLTRAIHDRHHAAKRNPYNEIECSDHYARAMASYGTFISACGFQYHGPKGHMAFDPKISPENFKAPFTSAEGWGTFRQSQSAGKQLNSVEIMYGKLRLKTFAVTPGKGMVIKHAVVKLGGKSQQVTLSKQEGKYMLDFQSELELTPSQKLEIMFETT
jgi:non-lysosomal glucosylceramidase